MMGGDNHNPSKGLGEPFGGKGMIPASGGTEGPGQIPLIIEVRAVREDQVELPSWRWLKQAMDSDRPEA